MKKYIVGFQIPKKNILNSDSEQFPLLLNPLPVNDIFGMQVIHSLTGLSGDFYHIQ